MLLYNSFRRQNLRMLQWDPEETSDLIYLQSILIYLQLVYVYVDSNKSKYAIKIGVN